MICVCAENQVLMSASFETQRTLPHLLSMTLVGRTVVGRATSAICRRGGPEQIPDSAGTFQLS